MYHVTKQSKSGPRNLILWPRPEQRKRDVRFGTWNIKMDLQEVGCECMDWIEMAQDRDRWSALVTTVMKTC